MNRYIFLLITTMFVFVGCSVKQDPSDTKKNQTQQTEQDFTFQTKQKQTSETSVFFDPVGVKVEDDPVLVSKENYIAVVYPSSEINRYALEAINTINGHFLQSHTNNIFHLESFDILKQSKYTINNVLQSIQAQGINKVILMITKDHLFILNEVKGIENLKIVLPLINKTEVILDNRLEQADILFAGISYKDQFEKLIQYTKGDKLIDFYDNSSIGSALHDFLSIYPLNYSRVIDDNNGRYKKMVASIKTRLDGSSLILNTPIVKSSMLLSSLTAEEISPKVILSTQLNFTPLVFSLTQRLDRNGLVIASSIGNIPDPIKGYSELLGNNILYNWVNYSSMISAEYLKTGNISLFDDLKIVDGQVLYPVKLYKVKRNSFSLLPF